MLQYINFIGLREFVQRTNDLSKRHDDQLVIYKSLFYMNYYGETFV